MEKATGLRAALFGIALVGSFLTGAIGADDALAGPIQQYTVPQMIRDAAWWYGVDQRTMLAIAFCESRYNANATGLRGERGIFQFAAATWAWSSRAAGYGGWSAYNAEANINTAAW